MSIRQQATVTINADNHIAVINPNIYGHFAEHLGSCIYEGIWVGTDSKIENENGIRCDVVRALKKIKPSIVRWPGGCFADTYHWQDGIGPMEKRPKRINIHWGGVTESNHFGTHEFMEFCHQIGANPYICGNLGSGTVQEMRDWLEYMNLSEGSSLSDLRKGNGHPEPFNVRYFGVGNENWGCGGHMSAEYYANEVKRYSCFLEPFCGKPFYKIACGPSGDDPAWTRRFFGVLSGCLSACQSKLELIQGFAAHYYCGTAGTATEYSHDQWYQLLEQALRMEPLIVKHRAIMDGFDPERKIGMIVDEWGTWHPVMPGTNPAFLMQQNTIRDALVAALTLNIFNRHADKMIMSNIAQMINVLQAMILTDGSEMVLTPTYHVYEMYAPFQGAMALDCRPPTDTISFNAEGGKGAVPHLSCSAALKNDNLVLSLVNLHVNEAVKVTVDIRGIRKAELVSWRVLAAGDIHDHNTFEKPDLVTPLSKKLPANDVITIPPAAVSVLKYDITKRSI